MIHLAESGMRLATWSVQLQASMRSWSTWSSSFFERTWARSAAYSCRRWHENSKTCQTPCEPWWPHRSNKFVFMSLLQTHYLQMPVTSGCPISTREYGNYGSTDPGTHTLLLSDGNHWVMMTTECSLSFLKQGWKYARPRKMVGFTGTVMSCMQCGALSCPAAIFSHREQTKISLTTTISGIKYFPLSQRWISVI